ncbi:AAA family ATPase [bacterium]|nr:AAA family ATPase [bacterium]
MLIIVCGLQGTGKSSVSKMIAEESGGKVLRTDTIRKELFSIPSYSEEEKKAVYEELFRRAGELLSEGNIVILDATFLSRINRKRARDLAEKMHHRLFIVEVECPQDTVEKRISQRYGDASDARFKHYLKYKDKYEKIQEPHSIVDSSGSFEDTHRQVKRLLGKEIIC